MIRVLSLALLVRTWIGTSILGCSSHVKNVYSLELKNWSFDEVRNARGVRLT